MSPDRSSEAQSEESLVDHLTALRTCLIRSLGYIFLGFAACWFFSEQLFDIIRAPIQPYLKSISGGLVFTAPMDKFMAHIKVSAFGGAILTSPGWIHQIWLFVAPALYKEEKKYAFSFLTFGTLLFLSGVSFAYFVVYPAAFSFLMNFGGAIDAPMITIGEYLSFFTTTTLVFGLAFEMPLIFTILGMMGLVTDDFLREKRRYAIVILAAVSALITPPDAISMALMMIPMVGLYESSIFLVKIFGQKPY
ncbi:MAG: twin-arginine translocase subunit TatC [Bdellovibrionales bacterium]|nr:twin-arginine translocase subunit TatC [Bdellovibrionales bacterium]